MESISGLRVYHNKEVAEAMGYSLEVAEPNRFDHTLRFFQVYRTANIYRAGGGTPQRCLVEWHATPQ